MESTKPANIDIDPERWVSEYGDYLYSYAMSRIYSTELAEDLLQETFLSAIQAASKFKGNSNEKTWLVSILKRKIVDHFRAKSKIEEQTFDTESPFIQDRFMHGHWKNERVPHEWDTEQSDWANDEEFIRILKQCIAFLPEKWQAVFSLKHVEEISTSDICKELEISDSNLWVILHRTRLQVRQCIENVLSK